MGTTVTTNARRRAVEQAQANSTGGLLTRLDLLAQRHGADVVVQHDSRKHKWVVGVQWTGEAGIGAGHARVESGSVVKALSDVLEMVHA